MTKDPTRAKILDLLRIEKSASAVELAHILNLTPAAVRYHLIRLERGGQVEVEDQDVHLTSGRPSRAYRLSREAQPNNLAGLSSVLLAMQLSQAEPELANRFWKVLAAQLAGTGPDLPQYSRRLSFAIRELNHMNYQARWEAGPHGPRIFLSNCPYAAIWPQFTGLCQMDRHMIETWTGRKLVQTMRIDFTGHKHQTCIFQEI